MSVENWFFFLILFNEKSFFEYTFLDDYIDQFGLIGPSYEDVNFSKKIYLNLKDATGDKVIETIRETLLERLY